jgi:hypothetical protein
VTQPDYDDRAPGIGDPTKSDDVDLPGLRSGGAGRAAEGVSDAPAPQGGDRSPDGEDVQVETAPGPQTDWLRSAEGAGDETGGGEA